MIGLNVYIINACYLKRQFQQRAVYQSEIRHSAGKVDRKENRIYIRAEFTRRKVKTAILMYCFHTAGVLHIFVLYNLLGPGTSFYLKSKINIKRNPNFEIGWFHN